METKQFAIHYFGVKGFVALLESTGEAVDGSWLV